jgi:hypothetical protein
VSVSHWFMIALGLASVARIVIRSHPPLLRETKKERVRWDQLQAGLASAKPKPVPTAVSVVCRYCGTDPCGCGAETSPSCHNTSYLNFPPFRSRGSNPPAPGSPDSRTKETPMA